MIKAAVRKILPLLFFTLLTAGFFFVPAAGFRIAQAQTYVPLDYVPQTTIPGAGINQLTTTTVGSYQSGKMTSTLLARYIKALYDYGMMIAGIVGAIVLMGGGLLWLTSGGNDSRIGQAKELIIGSVSGLAILFSSWVLLNTVNPGLLKMQVITTQVQKTQYFQESGFYENLADLPADMVYGWVCMNSFDQTCADTDPPTINLNIQLCYEGTPENARPSNCGTKLWCCGKSVSDVERSNICNGTTNGTPCRLNSTSVVGSGYCSNNKCEPCKRTGTDSGNEGASCGNHYECKSDYGTCGSESHGYCFCNIVGGNCTCRYEQPLF